MDITRAGKIGFQLRIAPFRFTEKGLFSLFAKFFQALIIAVDLFDILADRNLFLRLEEYIKIEIESVRTLRLGWNEEIHEITMKVDQIVDSTCKFDHIVNPATFLSPQFGNYTFVRKGLTGKIIVPGVTEIEIVLEKIDMGQNVIKDHHVQPVRVVVVIKGYWRSGIDDRFVRVMWIELVFPLLP